MAFHAADQVIASVVVSDITEVRIQYAGPYAPDGEVAAHIVRRLEQNPLSYDGVAWGYKGHSYDNESGVLELHIEDGLYSAYRYTSLDVEARTKFPPNRRFTAICPGALVRTSDGWLPLTRRPAGAQLSPGTWDIPCGHPSDVKDVPSTNLLKTALHNIIERHYNMSISMIIDVTPHLLILEEPKSAFDLIFIADIQETIDTLGDKFVENKKEFVRLACDSQHFIHIALADFMLSRPIPLSLIYYGRKIFGEKWFINMCGVEN